MDHNHLVPCAYSLRLIKKLESLDYENKLDFVLINKAIAWAKKYHDGQFRKSGEPYYTHPLEVAYMVSDYLLKTDVIVTSILHDIVEDTEVTAGMILDNFGRRIEKMVDMLTRDRPDGRRISVEDIMKHAIKVQDKEVILIKVMDRLHNTQSIHGLSVEKQQANARETLANFLLAATDIDLNIEQTFVTLCFDVLGVKSDRKDIFNKNSRLKPLTS